MSQHDSSKLRKADSRVGYKLSYGSCNQNNSDTF
jgi:hypothetical protein